MKITKLLLSTVLLVSSTVIFESCLWATPRNVQNRQIQKDGLVSSSTQDKNLDSKTGGNSNLEEPKRTARPNNLETSTNTVKKIKRESTDRRNIPQDSLVKLLDSIAWNETIHQFEGGVPTGPPATFRFIFTNYSNHPIKVKAVEAACSCTATDFSRSEIQQGDTGWIQTAYKTENTFGFFKKYVDVFFEGSPNKHRLYLTGSVDPYKKL
jgi:hypothetical protein